MAYTPFGEILGEKSTGFGFNAEWYDAATGMQNLRARQYEPAMNRFSQKDILRGSQWDPMSLNRYAYVQNDPINLIDPTGMASTGISNAINAISSIGKTVGNALGATVQGIVNAFVPKPVQDLIDTFIVQPVKRAAAPIIEAVKKIVDPVVKAAGDIVNTIKDKGLDGLLGQWADDDNLSPEARDIFRAAQDQIKNLDPSNPDHARMIIDIFLKACLNAEEIDRKKKQLSKEWGDILYEMDNAHSGRGELLDHWILNALYSEALIRAYISWKWINNNAMSKLWLDELDRLLKELYPNGDYAEAYLNPEQWRQKVNGLSFFNPNWSADQIVKHVEYAYNSVWMNGKGVYFVRVGGDVIKVVVGEGGSFETAYGIWKITEMISGGG